MTLRKAASIRWKLTGIMMAVSTVGLLIAAAVMAAFDWNRIRENQAHDLDVLAEIVAENVKSALLFDDEGFAQSTLEILSTKENIGGARIFDANGESFATYWNVGGFVPPVQGSEDGHRFSGERLETWLTVRSEGEPIGQVYLSSNVGFLDTRLTHYAGTLVAVLAFCLLVTFLLARRLQRIISQPLEDLTRVAQLVTGEEDYSLRAHTAAGGEMGILVHTFNQMLERVQDRDRELASHGEHLEAEVERRTAELTELNERLRHSMVRAEAATEAKSQFLATMSHEIRTPMNGVLGMLGLLQGTALDGNQHELAGVAKNSAESLLVIINDILDFSKIEAGRLEIEDTDHDLRCTIENTLDTIAFLAEDREVSLACLVHADVPRFVRGDPVRVRQVLTNLANNALKFTERGEVVLTISTIEDQSPTTTVRFEVRDTGPGIPAEKQDRLFRSFSQVDASDARRHGGTGLGLSISRALVELMGGRIGFDSVAGEGSTFWFELPFELQATPARIDPIPLERLRGLNVLIVDDDQTNRRVLSQQLAVYGCRPRAVATPAECLAILSGRSEATPVFDIVLLDFLMPEMDGIELAAEIRSLDRYAEVPLAILTSVGGMRERERLEEAGVNGHLSKPIKQSQLIECIAALLGAARTPAKLASTGVVTPHTLERIESREKKRVLVVEDNRVNQMVAVRLIAKIGFRCEVASDGLEALDALERNRFDLVLMDCQMPGMDGFEATRRIRASETLGGRELPIIAMTANAMIGDRERCLDSGMDDYLSKPVDPKLLRSTLERWTMDSHRDAAQLERPFEELIVRLEDSAQGGERESLRASLRALARAGRATGALELAWECEASSASLAAGASATDEVGIARILQLSREAERDLSKRGESAA